tara:strand:+ start:408 stop:1493 length:1086 start_codon:yes stop_codon:yes gene_type:complete
MSYKEIIIATGGTGGHIFPAYSLARYFIKNGSSVNIITDNRGMKFLKNFKDLKIEIINSETIFKKNPIYIIYSFIIVFYAIIRSFIFLLKVKPKIVFGMGGYSSFPVCLAAKMLRIPFIIYENNLVIGKANKFLLPFAKKMFVSYSELEGVNEKYKLKIAHIGNIVRDNILNFNKKNIDFKNKQISILVLGGSQAAKSFGEILPDIFEKCMAEEIVIKIYQQCLSSQKENLEKKYKSMKVEYELFNFTENLLYYFDKTDLVITRAGSSMMAELLNCKIPFVSVPFPYAADNHQLKNAKFFEKKGYSFLIEEHEIGVKLFSLIKSIYKDKNLLNQMINTQGAYSDKLVFKKIKDQIKELIND